MARLQGMLVPEWMVVKPIAPGMAGLWQFPCIPGSAEFFPGSVGKIPGSALTGIPIEVIDSKVRFNAIWDRKVANARISRLFSRFTGIWPLTWER
jgi:hypothetical protein